jgi:uroporphyrinogen decarboxylase
MSDQEKFDHPSPRERVITSLQHKTPDRIPVDFLATPEVWNRLIEQVKPDVEVARETDYFDPAWESLLRHLNVDCRVLSYDQFCQPPESIMQKQASVDWWSGLSRSTPNRMWRQKISEQEYLDIWGHQLRIAHNPTGAYEEFSVWPLSSAQSLEDARQYPWPEPDWWDFSSLPEVLKKMDSPTEYHIRFRVGSIFETAWQLRGMQEFLMDLAIDPAIPIYMMDRILDVHKENTRRVLEIAGDRLDMIYFYDDVATQNSLMISKNMWRDLIRPRHMQIIEIAKTFGKPVMYHCDGAIGSLIPELIDMGIDLLNPIQIDAKGMDPAWLKAEYGQQISFHGGIDIVHTLPKGSIKEVEKEVRERVRVLGKDGGYVLASSHHIQSDTPTENVIAMYQEPLRRLEE